MPGQQTASDGGRGAFLALVLGGLAGLTGLVFLVFVTNGFFAWVILIGLGIALFMGLHYILWGKSFEQSIAAERAALLESEED
jgi:cyanate permease